MPDPTPPDLMDVIDHAMETGDTSGTLDGSAEEPVGHVADEETPEGETPEGEETPEGGETPEGEEPAAEGDGERNADGTFKKKAKAEEKPEGETKPQTEAEKAAAAAAAAKKDPITDPIPKDLKPETQERIRTLISRTKEAEEKGAAVSKDFDYMINGIKATGTTPEQYGELLSWMSLFNSGNPEQQGKALEILDNMADRLAMLIGKERNIGDAMTNHPDLRDAVAKGQITAQYAKEIARTRNGQTFRQEITTQEQQRQQQIQQQTQEKQGAITSLNELEASLKATDPQYEAKKAQLLPILKPIFANLPPAQWRAQFEAAYRRVTIAAPQRVPKNQPMRGGRAAGAGGGKGSGNMATEPGSMLDAVNAALDGMGK
jgi:hypothetical protein